MLYTEQRNGVFVHVLEVAKQQVCMSVYIVHYIQCTEITILPT